MTHFEKITKSPETLAKWVCEITDFCDRGCSHCPVQEKCLYDCDGAGYSDNEEMLVEWLKERVPMNEKQKEITETIKAECVKNEDFLKGFITGMFYTVHISKGNTNFDRITKSPEALAKVIFGIVTSSEAYGYNGYCLFDDFDFDEFMKNMKDYDEEVGTKTEYEHYKEVLMWLKQESE